MTENEWLSSVDPERMMNWLVDAHTRHPLTSDRKLRCYVEACREIVSPTPIESWGLDLDLPGDLQIAATEWATSRQAPQLPLPVRADLLRDIFGNPFRPFRVRARGGGDLFWQAIRGGEVIATIRYPPEWYTWQNGTVPKIAQEIYDTRRFEDMPVLADALEDSGCTDAAILRHCRGQEPCPPCNGLGYVLPGRIYCDPCNGTGYRAAIHVRGCHVLDLLLNQE